MIEADSPELKWVEALRARYPVTVAHSVREGLERLEQEGPFDVLVCAERLPDGLGLEVIESPAAAQPTTSRAVIAEYEQVAEIFNKGRSLVCRVVNARAAASLKLGAVEELLGPPRAKEDEPPLSTLAGPPELDLLWKTAWPLLRQAPVVIRPFSDPLHLEVQLVVQAGPQFEEWRSGLQVRWGLPAKHRGRRRPEGNLGPEVREAIGKLQRTQELYLSRQGEFPTYLVLLPWKEGALVTVVLGVVAKEEQLPREQARELHRQLVGASAYFPVPVPPSDGARIWFAREYGWMVTPSYVGPDRRDRPTSFMNRFVFSGRRQLLPENGVKFSAKFIDRVHPTVMIPALVYLAFSALDTGLTYAFLHGHNASELNPVIRAALSWNAAGFIAIKNLLSLTGLLLVVRFQLWRLGKVALWINVAAYAALDGYWAWILTR